MSNYNYGWPRTSNGRTALVLTTIVALSQIGWVFAGSPPSAWFLWTIVACIVDAFLAIVAFVCIYGAIADWTQRGEGGDLDLANRRSKDNGNWAE